ncbi:MAG TPA: DegT/DnrJ/EryC1/StrS family aminotransferase [Candidatus Binataceae bacterium]
MQIKFVDLAAQNREIIGRVERELEDIHSRSAYVGGAQVNSFENEFAQFVGTSHAVGVGSGTDALRLALLALGAGPGDEVLTVPMTFIATAAAIAQTGARPVFIDIDPDTCNMNVAALRRYLEAGRFNTPNGPRAIVPVHLYGLPAAMIELAEVARRHALKIVEDACQAHGARVNTPSGWVNAGSIGDMGCFSFYPGKNLGAWGEAGAVVTNNPDLAERINRLRDHGRTSHYAHQECGYNARLDAIQAAVLRAKLEKLHGWNLRRRHLAGIYRQALAGSSLRPISEPEGMESCYHLFVVRSEKRDRIREALLTKQIECGIHYPVPLHLQPAFKALGYRAGDFPVAERAAGTVISLPMHPHLSDDDVHRIAKVAIEAAQRNRKSFAAEHSNLQTTCSLSPRT